MKEQGTGGDQTPFYSFYSQFYHNPQQKQNVNGHPQQQQYEIAPFNGGNYNNLSAPFNGESYINGDHYNNGSAPFNGESYNNVALPLNGESYINGDNYNNGSAPFNGESYNNVALPLNGESYINGDNYNNESAPFNGESYNNVALPESYINGLLHPLQLQGLPLSSHAPLTFCSSHHNIIHNNNNNSHYLDPQAEIQMHQAQIQMHQDQLQMLQQTLIQRQIQQQEQQTGREMQFRLRQNMEMDIQQFQQQQHMEQSMNVNVVSQAMETAITSVTPPNGEKRKRGRPRKLKQNVETVVASVTATPPNGEKRKRGRPINSSKNPNIIHIDNNNLYQYPQAQIQMLQAQLQMPQGQLQILQQTQIQRQIQQQEQQTSMEMQFQPPQNMEMDIQQIQLQQQQQQMEQSKNVNMNGVSQSMETVMASVAATSSNGEKNSENGPSTQPSTSAKTPQSLQSESGGAGLSQLIVIAPGQDVYEKIMSFCQRTPLTVGIINANGTISDVYFHEILSGHIVKHKGEFEIISLSCSYMMDNNGLCVTLISPDGKIFRGLVAGLLMAASHVEVVVGVSTSYPIYIPGQVGNNGPYIDSAQELYGANDTNEGNI